MGIKKTLNKCSDLRQMTLGRAFRDFILEKEAQNLSESTVNNYSQSFDYFLQFNNFNASTYTDVVNQSQIYLWINTMKENGVKIASINHYLRDCRAFFYWCMDSERGYMKPFKVVMVQGQEEQLKAFSDEDIKRLLVKPSKSDGFTEWRTWTIVNWIMATGNRAGTVCDVRLSDIDYESRDIVLHHTKNKKAQILPLSPTLEMALKEYVRMWRGFGEDGWLFCNCAEDKLTVNALVHSFSKYCKSRGVNQTNIHGLRHSFSRGWVRNNGSVFALQKILGHSDLEMTKKYVRLYSEDIKEDFEMFSPLDTIKQPSKRTHTVKRR